MSREDNIRKAVREHYGELANKATLSGEAECCCCGPQAKKVEITTDALRLGYTYDDISSVPEEANMGYGCGNPVAIASLKPGEAVLDLGSGGGFDCLLAARRVGPTGRIIGVDMTEEMLEKARSNAEKGGFGNVEFRLGKIEELPVEDASVDVVLSNCVINLSPEKDRVFKEVFRVLKPGGRVAVSDIVASDPLPEAIRRDINLRSCCIAGAAAIDEIISMMEKAGFDKIRVTPKEKSREFIRDWVPNTGIETYVVSAIIEATRPS